MEVNVLQLHKRPSEVFENIQDKFKVNENLNCFALADGTTQSFRSELWAELLCQAFQNNPIFEIENLVENFKLTSAEFKKADFKFSENLAISSLQKTKLKAGGTSTFLGIKIYDDGSCKAINCGDTNLFLIRNKGIEFFPFKSRDEIDKSTFFINSEMILRDSFDKTQIKLFEFNVEKNDTILLATDALSRMFLEDNTLIYEFLKVKNFDQLHSFCLYNWNGHKLEEDDISAIIIKNTISKSYLEILPPLDFKFPQNENKPIEIPKNMYNLVEKIEALEAKILKVNKELNSFKSKSKINLILMVFAITLSVVNLLGAIFLIRKSSLPKVNDKVLIRTNLESKGKSNIYKKLNDKKTNNISTETKAIINDSLFEEKQTK